jgi:hypothetical protein
MTRVGIPESTRKRIQASSGHAEGRPSPIRTRGGISESTQKRIQAGSGNAEGRLIPIRTRGGIRSFNVRDDFRTRRISRLRFENNQEPWRNPRDDLDLDSARFRSCGEASDHDPNAWRNSVRLLLKQAERSVESRNGVRSESDPPSESRHSLGFEAKAVKALRNRLRFGSGRMVECPRLCRFELEALSGVRNRLRFRCRRAPESRKTYRSKSMRMEGLRNALGSGLMPAARLHHPPIPESHPFTDSDHRGGAGFPSFPHSRRFVHPQ